jgi:hypothetical protein
MQNENPNVLKYVTIMSSLTHTPSVQYINIHNQKHQYFIRNL